MVSTVYWNKIVVVRALLANCDEDNLKKIMVRAVWIKCCEDTLKKLIMVRALPASCGEDNLKKLMVREINDNQLMMREINGNQLMVNQLWWGYFEENYNGDNFWINLWLKTIDIVNLDVTKW